MTTTQSSTICEPGAVVLVRFRFTSGEAVKRRPAVIVSGDTYHRSRADTVMVALSTQRERSYFGDCDIADWQSAGLPKPTKAKGTIQTIDRNTIERRLGTLTAADLLRVKESLKAILEF